MPRAKKQPIIKQEYLKIPKEHLRFSTPKEVAEYRARKLKCGTLVEIGSGIGGQTIAFAKRCKKVIAIEINKEKAEIAVQNFKRLGIKNVTLIIGDALSKEIIKKINQENPEIIFCDTQRDEEGKRTINNLSPKIKELLENYSKITRKIAIEIPPFTQDLNELKENFEAEFISLNKKLNRLTLYFNELKNSEISVVSLPTEEKIKEKKEAKKSEEVFSCSNFSYLYVIDPAIILAGLENELAENFNIKIINFENKKYFLSKEKITNVFLETYKIIGICNDKKEEITKLLKKLNSGKFIIRYSIKPEDYWKIRKEYEKELNGTKEVHIFKNKEEVVLCERGEY